MHVVPISIMRGYKQVVIRYIQSLNELSYKSLERVVVQFAILCQVHVVTSD